MHHDLTCTLGFWVYPIHQTSIIHETSMAHFQYQTHLSRNETLYENEPHAVWKDLSCVNNFMSSVTRRRVLCGTLDITLDISILIESTWCLLMVWGSFSHDDVIKWRHFPRYWPFVRGIHRSPVNSPHKGQWRGALMFSLIFAWTNGWVNNGDAGDLRRHRAHYDVTVTILLNSSISSVAYMRRWTGPSLV